MTSSSDFGELRSILASSPGIVTWRILCGLFDRGCARSISEIRKLWIPYALDHLKHWPDYFRVCPDSWLESFVVGDGVPMLELVRCVQFHSHEAFELLLASLQYSPLTQKIKRLEFNDLSVIKYSNLLRNTHFPLVTSLALHRVWSDGAAMLACLESFPNLDTLSVDLISTSGLLGNAGLSVIPHTIRSLNLGSSTITNDTLLSFAESSFWRRLRTLSLHRALVDEKAKSTLLMINELQSLDFGHTRLFNSASDFESFCDKMPNLKSVYAEHLPASWNVTSCDVHRKPLIIF